MKNEFNFNVKIRCGVRTEPEAIVYYTGNEDYMLIGNNKLSKDDLASWISKILLHGIKKAITQESIK